jgi:hypothetical protein
MEMPDRLPWRRILGSSLAALGLAGVAAASGSLLGASIDQAPVSEFFRWFHLEQTEVRESGDSRREHVYRPSGATFHELAAVTIRTASGKTITSATLQLTRGFIDHERDHVFARDITKSFLYAFMPPGDLKKVEDFTNEIERGAIGSPGIIHRTVPLPPVPVEPSPGYKVFLGRAIQYRFEGEQCALIAKNAETHTIPGATHLTLTLEAKPGR